MSPVRDEVVNIQEGRQSTPDFAAASMSAVSFTSITSNYAKVPDQPFRLMDLPVELRSMIFKEILVMPGPVLFRTVCRQRLVPFAQLDSDAFDAFESMSIWSYDDFFGTHGGFTGFHRDFIGSPESMMIRQSSLLNIFSASKIVFRETVPLYFGCNQFDFENLDRMERFFSKVGAEYRWQITSIAVGYIGRAPAKAIKRLRECVALRELTLTIYCLWVESVCRDIQREVSPPGMRDLLRIRGLNKINLVPDAEEVRLGHTILDEQIIDSLKKQLEVLKEPRDPKQLKRQEKKDFPTKAKRTVFGAANVVTRSEKQMQKTHR